MNPENVLQHTGLILFAALLIALPGCGVQPVTGGTPGELIVGGQPLSDIQITLYQADGTTYQPIGFAVSALDGSFALFTNGAAGPLNLNPGEYRCTLESAGAPVQIPPAYAKAETTPLVVTWNDGDALLKLEVAAAFPAAR